MHYYFFILCFYRILLKLVVTWLLKLLQREKSGENLICWPLVMSIFLYAMKCYSKMPYSFQVFPNLKKTDKFCTMFWKLQILQKLTGTNHLLATIMVSCVCTFDLVSQCVLLCVKTSFFLSEPFQNTKYSVINSQNTFYLTIALT